MAVLKIRDENGIVHSVVSLKGEPGSTNAAEVAYEGSTEYTTVSAALDYLFGELSGAAVLAGEIKSTLGVNK